MREIEIKGIKWDTDGVSIEELGLPTDVTFSVDDDKYQDILDNPDTITDMLSNEYGYCVCGYESDNLGKTFRTCRSTSKHTAKYCVNYNVESSQKTAFFNTLREARTFVAQLKEQGYMEEKTDLSLTL
jgi:hypothetical protein